MAQVAKVAGVPLNVTSARLLAVDSDTLVATVSGAAIVRGTNDPSYFEITFTSISTGWYRLNLLNGSTLIAQVDQIYVAETISTQPITPPVTPGLCNVRFLALDRATPIVGAKVYVELEELNPTVDTALISRAEYRGTTGAEGFVDLALIQFTAFTRGGTYRVRVTDPAGRVIHDRKVRVPTVTTCYAEDLLDA